MGGFGTFPLVYVSTQCTLRLSQHSSYHCT
jgi:hypothetical protein